jgi:outer membrane protein assembly factor BamE (lipoprotein component of BamABCDE complex)
MKSLGFVLVWTACAAISWGQAAVETAVGAGASTGAAAGAKGAGQAVGGVFGALSKTHDQAPKASGTNSTGSSPATSTPSTPAKAAAIVTKPIDPAQVTIGMERDEVLNRVGEPATRTSQIRRSQMMDTFWYKTESKDELIVSLTDGKVVSTALASQRKRTAVASTRR